MYSNTGIRGAVFIGNSAYIRIYTQAYRLTYFIRAVAILTDNNQIKEIISLLKQIKTLKNQLRKEKLTTEIVTNAN
jgi:hypothetical protein